jgi:hypothetical protein
LLKNTDIHARIIGVEKKPQWRRRKRRMRGEGRRQAADVAGGESCAGKNQQKRRT